MPHSPIYDPQITSSHIQPIDQVNPEGIHIHDELDLLPTTPTASRPTPRKSSHAKPKKVISKWKGKRVRDLTLADEGECPLLNLPEDLIHTLLSRIPPRDLTRLAVTCKDLYEELEDESIWRQSYVNRFLYDGAARDIRAKEDVKVLVQGCLNNGGRGWKREALSREAMINRWTDSKASMVIHTPPTGLIHSLSLSYPPFIPAPSKSLVVGKNHQTPTKAKSSPTLLSTTPSTPQSTNANAEASSSNTPSGEVVSPTPTKLTHRQKYEAILAATTRPPPHVLSASIANGGVVRSDPISGKVSKGFWGPGRDANFHLRPHPDPSAEPSSLYLPTRTQSFILWGLRTGSVVHTTMQSRHHATHGGRASSVNVQSEFSNTHQGEVTDIWAPESPNPESLRWVTGGEDGRVKLWQFHAGSGVRSGKRTPNEAIPASIECLFTSDVIDQPFENRSDASKRRQNGRPDPIILARYDPVHDVTCGVTVDGDLRVWFSTSSRPVEVRIDVGAEEVEGGVKHLCLDVKKSRDGETVASVLIHHRRSPILARYDITPAGDIQTKELVTPVGSSISSIHTSFQPTKPISAPSKGTSMSAKIVTPGETPETASPAVEKIDPFPTASNNTVHPDTGYGRFVMAGDEMGYVHIWAWDVEEEGRSTQRPMKSWEAMNGKVTALNYSCGLVAVGSFDGYIKIFDPLPYPPMLLRMFHASRLTPGELLVAASEEPDARWYTVNKVILENDLVVASIGRKVFAWRAGSGKGRQGGKESGWRRTSGSRGDGKGSSRGLDMKAIHRAAVDDHSDLESPSAARITRHEAREVQAMEDMGLDGDDALQYALMLSMEEQNSGNDNLHNEDGEGWEDTEGATTTERSSGTSVVEDDGMDEETREAIRQVEAFKKQEEDELSRVLEMIRISEQGGGT
ncbi:hypothetical protein I302_107382 [Kwoniella bestiolae CBS 10118]|uniref:F-box domain-containing protein n=1 Tax=Kwoniella bestiolae CBS 10118 TaxID=1296100 RepID=A0A1B9FYQ3_9TREE|nr:hypothetical protein I302_06880 [Kwoniella bestiolae CBS 10118]OCF23894.1 hypothetical protein I302_06880 [Kwoniella bestiolae CBS 10118]